MRTLDSWKRQEVRLRSKHTELTKAGEWIKAQTVRQKLIQTLNTMREHFQ